MRIEGPERYQLTIKEDALTVLCAKGTNKFSGLVTKKLPKLYVVSISDKPIYVGITKQSVSNRLRFGMKATGENGYHGYAWRHGNTSANLDIWCHVDAVDRKERDIETVEAELVYLIRSAGQWPEFQTEIHFYPSSPLHREIAAQVMTYYKV
jgi:hypothetical protein